MPQTVYGLIGDQLEYLLLPDPRSLVLPGVRWGKFQHFLTPAYWKSQCWQSPVDGEPSYRLGETLAEEAAACCLGGHGIPAEIGVAAFRSLRAVGAFAQHDITARQLLDLLSTPIFLGSRRIQYRFPRQKSEYLAPLLQAIHSCPPGENDHRAFRDWFLQFKGVGLKTASWITRNWLGSSQVAIIDIHIQRSCAFCGLYGPELMVERNYLQMEKLFIEFALRLQVPAAQLDTLMWKQARVLGSLLSTSVVRLKSVVGRR